MTTTTILMALISVCIGASIGNLIQYFYLTKKVSNLKNSVIDIQYNLTNRGVDGNTLASHVHSNSILLGKLLKHLNLNCEIEPATVTKSKIVLVENKPEESTNKHPSYGGVMLLSERDKVDLREHCLVTAHVPGKGSKDVLESANEYYNFVVNGTMNSPSKDDKTTNISDNTILNGTDKATKK